MKEIVGERYKDFPDSTIDLLSQLWDKAVALRDPSDDDLAIRRHLTLDEIREVRDCLLNYTGYANYPDYPMNRDGTHVEHDDPRLEEYHRLHAIAEKTAKEVEFYSASQHEIPLVAPISIECMADAVANLEQRNCEVLLWVMPPKDFADIKKAHLQHHASGVLKLIDDASTPVVAVLWGVPIVKSNDIWFSYCVGCHGEPLDPDKPTFTMLQGRHLRFCSLSVTR